MAARKAEDTDSGNVLHGAFIQSPSAPAPVALTPARDNLRQAIARLAQAQREVEIAGAPAPRLLAVIAQYDAQTAKLAECHATDRQHLAAEIAAGSAIRTYTSPETEAANAAALELTEARQAALEALPQAEAAHREAIERRIGAIAERDQAVATVMTEEMLPDLLDQYEAAEMACRALDERLASIFRHLQAEADRGAAASAAARERIAAVVKGRRAAIPKAPQSNWYAEQVAGLSRDPSFGLGLPE